MPDGVEQHAHPDLRSPVMVVALEGWIDAGSGASGAIAELVRQLAPTPLATFDPDLFIDFRARRPTMHIRDGVNVGLTWPEITMSYAQDGHGTDVVLLTGQEPDAQWYKFCALVRDLALRLGVRLVVGLGSYPIGVPHTRPTLVSCTASMPELAAVSGLLRNSVDVPAGVAAALERSFAEVNVPAIGLWAQVPHYATGMPFPAASASLLDSLNSVADLAIETRTLTEAAQQHRGRLDELVRQSDEHQSMVQQLEGAYDNMVEQVGGLAMPGTPLPSGDELAAEVERFLRDQEH
jgi:proteasome assembly chaperone (PAC2) family protein